MDSQLNSLYNEFTNPNSPNFASVNINDIYRNSKSDSSQHPVSRSDILEFQASLESLSRQKERRLLRGRKRKASFRKWIVFCPRHLIVGDLCFLRQLDSTNKSQTTIAVFMDAFSRLAHLSTQRTRSSKATLKSFNKAIAFFSKEYSNTYKLFNSDLGTEFRGAFIRLELGLTPSSQSYAAVEYLTKLYIFFLGASNRNIISAHIAQKWVRMQSQH